MEEVTTEVATVFTKKHHEIGQDLVDRVIELLQSNEKIIKSYEVSKDYDAENESIRLSVGDKFSLRIALVKIK